MPAQRATRLAGAAHGLAIAAVVMASRNRCVRGRLPTGGYDLGVEGLRRIDTLFAVDRTFADNAWRTLIPSEIPSAISLASTLSPSPSRSCPCTTA